mgnify:CR=1 FL=1|jgi:amino acid transporter
MVSNDASTGDIKSSANEISTEPKNAFQDTKQADAEQSYPEANPGELKRKLKSRHLQMIAIGMSLLSPLTSNVLTIPRWNNRNRYTVFLSSKNT